MTQNPYGKHQSSFHFIQAKVSPEDFYFFKKRYAFSHGIIDAVVATLWKKLIDELRTIDAVTPIEPTIHSNDTSHILLENLLSEFCRRTAGEPAGGSRPRPQRRGTRRIRKTLQRPPQQRGDKESEDTFGE